MRAAGVHHVSINVTDLEAARDFYTGVLGLTVRGDRPELGIRGVWLDAGGTQVHLIDVPPPEARGQHFALRVDDIDAAVADLRAQGIEVSEPKTVGPNRQCMLHDPSGNMVELNQPG